MDVSIVMEKGSGLLNGPPAHCHQTGGNFPMAFNGALGDLPGPTLATSIASRPALYPLLTESKKRRTTLRQVKARLEIVSSAQIDHSLHSPRRRYGTLSQVRSLAPLVTSARRGTAVKHRVRKLTSLCALQQAHR